ncbi:Ldb19p KNAG_0L00470 [Huiozyma naganishii CBS 8797]|uniref:LDB19 N-terminal domain-containing protein n=1 Tax=Huiozyma naganishii (strain ATCC MYA-139 / BCRC 22969 / CBS 8797 / KCTC 17520 / NBRC 10181 / NCYC 3082 / Yp74L-3) TaxID=1071383 RepID=J7RCS0_HUIN7|nr:hypothetical protein KNAG_0L00470 [Kazachstania naganishii CBS 8797]CCK72670.1 hypothetical protein KNAG_0L00470 [Kazachstania naganishii CBS 8797]
MVFAKLYSSISRSENSGDSLLGGASSGSSSTNSRDYPIELAISVESPPCVMYGTATESSGALLSGVFTLTVKDPHGRKGKHNSDTLGDERLAATNSADASDKRRSGLFSTFSNLAITNSNQGNQAGFNAAQSKPKIMSGYTKVKVKSVTLSLVQRVHYQKPFVPDTSAIQNCANCKNKITNMKVWQIQTMVLDKTVGVHSYPFSYLVPGSVPSTCGLGFSGETRVSYELCGVVTYYSPHYGKQKEPRETSLRVSIPIPITRSITRGPDKNSLRVFPPTELTAAAVLPNVIYPKSTFPLEMKLDGISSDDRRWRMRKLSWRIEETTRVRSNACKVHTNNLSQLEQEIQRKEIERSKKPAQAIKRYGDIGPQIRVSVASPDNMPVAVNLNNTGVSTGRNATPLGRSGEANNAERRSNEPPHQQQRRATNSNGMRDNDDDDEDSNDADTHFIHPSDDALRQEILEQQQRIKEEQLRREIAKNNSTLFTEEIRIVSKGEIKNGWKTDFDNNGKIELVTDIDCMALNSGVYNPLLHASTANPHVEPKRAPITIAGDIQDPNLGIYVSHVLAVEIVVAEETLQYSNGQPVNKSKSDKLKSPPNSNNIEPNNADQRLAELSPMFANRNTPKVRLVSEEGDLSPSTSRNSLNGSHAAPGPKIVSVPTGAARVLRMQFRLNVTERSGLGISWDEEVPPIYQDVKDKAPPCYENVSKGTVISHVDLGVVDGDENVDEFGDAPQLRRVKNSDLPIKITPPPVAYHGGSSSSTNNNENGHLLTTVQSPQLEPIISLQGNVPFRGQVLTPANTRNVAVRNVSELLDTDRITQ